MLLATTLTIDIYVGAVSSILTQVVTGMGFFLHSALLINVIFQFVPSIALMKNAHSINNQ